jgi:hypothetical protein
MNDKFSILLLLLQSLEILTVFERRKNLVKKDDILDRRCTSQLCVQKVKGGEEERDRSDTTSGCGTGQSSEEGVSNYIISNISIINKCGACFVQLFFSVANSWQGSFCLFLAKNTVV